MSTKALLISVVFILLGPIVGALLFGLVAFDFGIFGFVPLGHAVGGIPAVGAALTFYFLTNRTFDSFRSKSIISISASTVAATVLTFFFWTLWLHSPFNMLLLLVCIVAGATAFLCSCVCLAIPVCRGN